VVSRVARWLVLKPKIPIWVNFGGPYAGICYGHLEYFTVIWYILLPFGIIVVIWYIFPRFGTLCQEKSGNPGGEGSPQFTCLRLRPVEAFDSTSLPAHSKCARRRKNRMSFLGHFCIFILKIFLRTMPLFLN
jgi:hypothetical protein